MKTLVRLLLGIIPVIGIYACVEPYEADFRFENQILVVDGFITDAPEPDTIRLYVSNSNENFSNRNTVDNASVSVVVQDGATVLFTNAGKGRYAAPAGFRGQVGKSYQLKFKIPDRGDYESDFQTLTAVPEIAKVYERFDEKGILDNTGTKTTPANLVYVDFQDPPSQRNFYLWRYIHWERQDFCATCEQGIYIKPTESCQKIVSRFTTPPTYDYQCDRECWEVFYSTTVNAFSDINAEGRFVEGRLVAKIPLYSRLIGCLVEVQQYSISSDAYRFYKILENQTQSSGGLTDTPPAPITGNVKNTNNTNENIVGYFCASGIKKTRFYIDRKNATGVPLSLLGRSPNLEPADPFGRPPLAKCFEGPNRTGIRPVGWPK